MRCGNVYASARRFASTQPEPPPHPDRVPTQLTNQLLQLWRKTSGRGGSSLLHPPARPPPAPPQVGYGTGVRCGSVYASARRYASTQPEPPPHLDRVPTQLTNPLLQLWRKTSGRGGSSVFHPPARPPPAPPQVGYGTGVRCGNVYASAGRYASTQPEPPPHLDRVQTQHRHLQPRPTLDAQLRHQRSRPNREALTARCYYYNYYGPPPPPPPITRGSAHVRWYLNNSRHRHYT